MGGRDGCCGQQGKQAEATDSHRYIRQVLRRFSRHAFRLCLVCHLNRIVVLVHVPVEKKGVRVSGVGGQNEQRWILYIFCFGVIMEEHTRVNLQVALVLSSLTHQFAHLLGLL
jgi:hypothetical protein